MFCYQCEQTPSGGCKVIGVCGKNEDIASLLQEAFNLKLIDTVEKDMAEMLN